MTRSLQEIARQAARSMKTYDGLDQVADAVTVAVLQEVKRRFDAFGLAQNLPSQRIINGLLLALPAVPQGEQGDDCVLISRADREQAQAFYAEACKAGIESNPRRAEKMYHAAQVLLKLRDPLEPRPVKAPRL